MSQNNFAGLLKWRSIGPYRGGRVVAVAGDPNDRNVFYFGACAGGVWKTDDGGNFWKNISDGYFNTAAVGALAVAESDPNIIYAGTGESTIRIDVSYGDGVYKTDDGGRTWKHVGLKETRFIGKIRIHPTNPDIVYVAALGHAFGPNEERGVFKSTDGGESWRKVLYKSDKAGAVDLSIDPNNPRIIYATVWETYRNWWMLSSGGEDSGLYKSTDGGETWTEITGNRGLPGGVWGKSAVAVSPAQPGRVWALIENEKGGMYRSDDYGENWLMVSDKTDLLSRAWYYTHITADTTDADTVYVNCLRFWKSSDGGRTYDMIGTPHGDNHDLWIDPVDNQRMVQGNDGGANVSYNGGITWSTIYNQPTGQIYRMDTDNQAPYRVYGTQQDNSSLSVPSRTQHSSITWTDCYLAGSGESGWIACDPEDSDIVFVGAIGSSPGGGNALQRYDHRTREIRLVTTWPRSWRGHGAEKWKYRFSWTYPILFSKHDPNRLFAGGNVLFETRNEGQSWQPISPDLTRADPATLGISGGPINREIGAAETYATIFAVGESNHEAGVIYTGSDDGLMHITRDDGQSWQDCTPPGLGDWTMFHTIECSPHDKGTVYVAATRFKMDDYKPYLFKTKDYGQTWTQINDGIADDHFTRVIRADPDREGLLYAGTEAGLYISFDDGASWEQFQLNLPVCPIYDMQIKEKDLVVATHGRAFWILDDLTPLHTYEPADAGKALHLYAPRDTVRRMPFVFEGAFRGAPGKNYMSTLGLLTVFEAEVNKDGTVDMNYLDSGDNPPKGVIVTYNLAEAGPASLTVHDAAGNLVCTHRSKGAEDKDEDGPYLPAAAGWNRFIWDMRTDEPTKVNGDDAAATIFMPGAVVAPGRYRITLHAAGQQQSVSFNLLKEPASRSTQEELDAQSAIWQRINRKFDETAGTINQMRDLRAQLDGWNERLAKDNPDLAAEAASVSKAVLAIEETLAVPGLRPGWTEPTNAGIRLLDQLAALVGAVSLGNYGPTDQAQGVYDDLSSEIDEQLTNFGHLLEGPLDEFNQKLANASVPGVLPVG